MNKLLSFISILAAFTWAVGYFKYHEGHFIHIFLAVAVAASLLRILRGTTIHIR